MRAFVINLERAPERWTHMAAALARAGIEASRVAALDGRTLRPTPEQYSARRYRLLHGRNGTPEEVGCYLSHLKAMGEFLATDEEHALICEDDLALKGDLPEVISALLRLRGRWNIVRLTGLSRGGAVKVRRLCGNYFLGVNLGRMKGTGAYLLDRRAARAFSRHLLPMRLPYDHAFDREWFYGLTCASVRPFPVSQTDDLFPSSMQHDTRRLSRARRWGTTYPYQCFNEVTRGLCRSAYLARLGLRLPWGKRPGSDGE